MLALPFIVESNRTTASKTGTINKTMRYTTANMMINECLWLRLICDGIHDHFFYFQDFLKCYSKNEKYLGELQNFFIIDYPYAQYDNKPSLK